MRVIVVLALMLFCQRAGAEPARTESYRGPTLVVSGIAVGVVALGVSSDSGALTLLGAGTFVVGAPLVHMSKGRNGRAAASLAMRVGIPLVGLMIGDMLPRDCGPSGDCISSPPAAVYVGFGAGVVAATALDVIFLAKGEDASWTPVATPTRDGLAFGIAGQF